LRREALLTVAEALGYDKITRLRRDIDNHNDQILISVLEGSINSTNALFFFPGEFYEISPFGTRITSFISRDVAYLSSYIISYPTLDEKFLRRLFTGIELLAFKICHLLLEGQKRGYHFESESLRKRVHRMKNILEVPDWERYLGIFDEILFTRDAFAHSFMDIFDITYKGIPLKACFDRISNAAMGGTIFMNDVRFFFDPIYRVFSQHQLDQVDKEKLFRSCDQLIKRRTLAR
jgi:hypothetical protein